MIKVSYGDELLELMSSKILASFLLPDRISVHGMRMTRKKKVPNAGIQVHVCVRGKKNLEALWTKNVIG